MLAGLLAGVLVFGFGKLVGEPPVDRALRFESVMDQAHEEPMLVSRTVQAGWGLLTGVLVYATAFGGLFALVFAVADRRVADLGPRGVSASLAVAGFIAVYLVPTLKYPANPPSVGLPDTIGQRTALYFTMLALSVTAMVFAAILRKRLVSSQGGWNAALMSAAFYLVAVTIAGLLLPGVDEVPDTFPAVVLWQFRIASLGMQLVMWSTFGVVFGVLAEKVLTPGPGFVRRAGTPYRT